MFYPWKEADGQRNVHKHFGDLFSQGMSSCESKSPYGCGQLVVSPLATVHIHVLGCTHTHTHTHLSLLVANLLAGLGVMTLALFLHSPLPLPSSQLLMGQMGGSGHGPADVGAAGEWCRVSQSPLSEAEGKILHRTARNCSKLCSCLVCFPLPGTHVAQGNRGALESYS